VVAGALRVIVATNRCARDVVRCTRARLVAFAESGNKSVATVVGFSGSNTNASHLKSEITTMREVLFGSVARLLHMRKFCTPRMLSPSIHLVEL
jgi:hypothetical protein